MCCLLAALIGLLYSRLANPSSPVDLPDTTTPPPEGTTLDQATIGLHENYNLEGWSCGMRQFASRNGDLLLGYLADDLDRTCELAVSMPTLHGLRGCVLTHGRKTAARWIMIPLFLATVVMVGCSIWLNIARCSSEPFEPRDRRADVNGGEHGVELSDVDTK